MCDPKALFPLLNIKLVRFLSRLTCNSSFIFYASNWYVINTNKWLWILICLPVLLHCILILAIAMEDTANHSIAIFKGENVQALVRCFSTSTLTMWLLNQRVDACLIFQNKGDKSHPMKRYLRILVIESLRAKDLTFYVCVHIIYNIQIITLSTLYSMCFT